MAEYLHIQSITKKWANHTFFGPDCVFFGGCISKSQPSVTFLLGEHAQLWKYHPCNLFIVIACCLLHAMRTTRVRRVPPASSSSTTTIPPHLTAWHLAIASSLHMPQWWWCLIPASPLPTLSIPTHATTVASHSHVVLVHLRQWWRLAPVTTTITPHPSLHTDHNNNGICKQRVPLPLLSLSPQFTPRLRTCTFACGLLQLHLACTCIQTHTRSWNGAFLSSTIVVLCLIRIAFTKMKLCTLRH